MTLIRLRWIIFNEKNLVQVAQEPARKDHSKTKDNKSMIVSFKCLGNKGKEHQRAREVLSRITYHNRILYYPSNKRNLGKECLHS